MNHPLRLLASVALVTSVACAKSEPPPPPAPPGPPAVVRVVARDYSFEMPDTLTAGLTTFVLADSGAELHHIQIARLEQGKTVADLAELKPGVSPPAWFVEIGGPNAAVPGGPEISGTLDLAPGNYVALCFIPSPAPDLKPHFVKGMVHPFVVVATDEMRQASEPHFTITLNDFNFNFSAPIPAGTHDVRVVNAGPQAHEVLIVRLDPGKKATDLLTWFGKGMTEKPPGTPVGGTTGIAPNGENLIKLTLTPGEYGLYCFVDDAKDGKMHIEHGMVSQFTVQ